MGLEKLWVRCVLIVNPTLLSKSMLMSKVDFELDRRWVRCVLIIDATLLLKLMLMSKVDFEQDRRWVRCVLIIDATGRRSLRLVFSSVALRRGRVSNQYGHDGARLKHPIWESAPNWGISTQKMFIDA